MQKKDNQTVCNLCGKGLSINSSSGTLRIHLQTHGVKFDKLIKKGICKGDSENNATSSDEQVPEPNFDDALEYCKPQRQLSYVWKYLVKGEECVTCQVCQKDLSIKSSTGTLANHLETHGIQKEPSYLQRQSKTMQKTIASSYDGALESVDLSEETKANKSLTSIAMQFMKMSGEVLTCNVCLKEFSVDSSGGSLLGHLTNYHGLAYQGTLPTNKGKSPVWKYMDKDDFSVFCMICNKKFSLKTSTGSLSGHLESFHDLKIELTEN